ncbi:MAG TPA: acetyl-CoA carboxylase biotin carboxylase subunit [Candidatus Omnitrophica bacterium]|nr:acetyl-CoA carboxylase biotin carboxylase subunit [Candidatus Omnitrophota bacterium]
MFSKVLIANRGEIAVRIIRTLREMGIVSVAVYSQADRDSLHTKLADESICIGPALPSESYLNMAAIISAAEIANVEAIHPGYGFLAENAHFAEVCNSCNITFIGPSPEVIRIMGDKAEARKMMSKAGIPVLPGSEEVVSTKDEALKIAKRIGYPVIIKAAKGGGGKGMRIAYNDGKLVSLFITCQREVEAAFGDSSVYIEKFIPNPRHIEVQILADKKGNVVTLGERDCSIQRRYQKLLEESPSPVVDSRLRRKLCEAAIVAVKAINYTNAGTVEFLMDDSGNFYFMEMNTRLQVEHPVTEMVTAVDLVKEQVLIANGQPLDYSSELILQTGWAIECRVNAGDASSDFAPSPGRITHLHLPGGPFVRVDTHLYDGYHVPPYYDSLLAKLIVWGKNRDESIARMRRALAEFSIEGIKTTLQFHRQLLSDPLFVEGDNYSKLLEKVLNIQRKEVLYESI